MVILNDSSNGLVRVAAAAVIVTMVAAGVYRRIRLKRRGIDPIPPIFQSVFADVIFWSIAMGIYGFVVGALIDEDPSIARRMTGFFVLMGAFLTIRRRRWPNRSGWYDAAAAASAVILSVPLGLIMERVF